MTDQERMKIDVLRKQGLGYKKIAAETGISVNTVKSYCQSHSLDTAGADICEQCGMPVTQTPHRKRKRFCSDECRTAWWSAHPEMRKVEKPYAHKCLQCGAEFSSDRKDSRYCSLACNGKAKRKEAAV